MASPTFGLTSNNAPLPPPTSLNMGGNNKGVGFNGANPYAPAESGSAFPLFTTAASGPSGNPTTAPTGVMGGLSSGFGGPNTPYNQNLYNMLGKEYGQGFGELLGNLLTGGLFNPQVAQELWNSMQPAYQQGLSSTEAAFGAEGSRFGSAAAYGVGSFNSQFDANYQGQLVNMFLSDQQMGLNLLESVLPGVAKERANSGGLLGDILGGAESLAGVAMEFVPGLQAPGAALISGGIGTIAGSNRGSSSPSGSISPNIPMPGMGANTTGNFAMSPASATSPFGFDLPTSSPSLLDISAGMDLGGTDPWGSFNPVGDPSQPTLYQ